MIHRIHYQQYFLSRMHPYSELGHLTRPETSFFSEQVLVLVGSTVTEKMQSEKKIDTTDSESSDDENGYEYVINTYVHGDARDP